ncbi:hypothetical protein [Salibacterium aidingense]
MLKQIQTEGNRVQQKKLTYSTWIAKSYIYLKMSLITLVALL